MRRLIFVALALLILAQGVLGARVSGSIYDLDLAKMENVIVEVDTSPKQTFIAKDGDYDFNIPRGSYVISARYLEEGEIVYSAEEEIVVKEEGEYVLDLIMFPYLGPDEEDLDPYEEGVSKIWYFVGFALLLGVLIGLIWYFFHRKGKEGIEEGGELEKVTEIIRKEGGRITQLDLRSRLGLSEAKVSLILTELESKGLVKKVKKGIGNVIILNR